jgi:ArsR family transcriptional regulator
MGVTKTNQYSQEILSLAQLFKALGLPARLAIVQHLLKVDSCIGGELVLEFPLAQATVSQHLRELKEARIIKGSIEGNAICYCLEASIVHSLSVFLQEASEKLNKNKEINCC